MTQPGMTADYIKIIQTPMRCLFGLEAPSREEFWRYLNHNLSSLFSIFNYHFGKRVFKSTQVFHVYILHDCSTEKSIIATPPIIPTTLKAAGPTVKWESPKILKDDKIINNNSTAI
jgi:hypothetical protein